MSGNLGLKVKLVPAVKNEYEKFIRDLQAAFKVAVVEEFGPTNEEVIPDEDIKNSMSTTGAEVYHIVQDGKIIGGTVIAIDNNTHHNSLDLLFINASCHSHSMGLAAWKAIEKLHPETIVWETHTPYFEKRNIHFYVNKCGFHIVEFFNPHHPNPHPHSENDEVGDYFFRFEKDMTCKNTK